MRTWLASASSSRRTHPGSSAGASTCRPAALTSTPDRSTSSPALARRTDGSGTSAAGPCAKGFARSLRAIFFPASRMAVGCPTAIFVSQRRSSQYALQLLKNFGRDVDGPHLSVDLLHADRGDSAASDHHV